MGSDSVSSSVPFFPDSSTLKPTSKKLTPMNSGDSNSVTAKSAGEPEDFAAVFGKTSGPAKAHPEKSQESAQTQKPKMANKMDKPKLGNREPFFPQTPMPYHPEGNAVSDTRSTSSPVQEAGRPQVEPLSHDLEGNPEEVDYGHLDSHMPQGRVGVSDDRSGVMNESYDGSAVSYPMSRIGGESMDDKTKEMLQEQDLWDLPTMVVAQPSAKLGEMAQGNVAMKSMDKGSVPVQKPIAQFMASLENELGVSPDRLVQAFQNLPPGQMQLPPQQTMIQVLKNLNVSEADKPRAMQLYTKMLAQMQVLGEDRMKMTPQFAPQMASMTAGGLTTGKLENQIEGAQGLSKADVASKYAQASELGQQPQVPTVKPEAKSHEEVFSKVAVGENPKAALGDNAKLVDSQNGPSSNATKAFATDGMVQFDLKNQGQDSQSQNFQQNFSQNANQTAAPMVAAHEQANVKDQVKFDLKHDNGAHDVKIETASTLTQNINQNVNGQDQFSKSTSSVAPSGIAAGEMKASGMEAKHEAIQTIVNNAQMLAQKGGGEMQLTLKPDHLGEIQLKVAMDGNRVNVQMTTDRGEVKKLIEQSVHELKHGLAQHNLSMEKLDVSVNNRDASGFNRGQPDFTAARDFANQFHQQNGRREMLDDLSSLRTNAAKAMNTMDHASDSANKARKVQQARSMSARSAGRLNVVA